MSIHAPSTDSVEIIDGKEVAKILTIHHLQQFTHNHLEAVFTGKPVDQTAEAQVEVEREREATRVRILSSIADMAAEGDLSVLRVGGEVAGIVGFQKAGETADGREVYEIMRMSVLKDFRGNKFYVPLMEHVSRQVREKFPASPILMHTKAAPMKTWAKDHHYRSVSLMHMMKIYDRYAQYEEVPKWITEEEEEGWEAHLFDPLSMIPSDEDAGKILEELYVRKERAPAQHEASSLLPETAAESLLEKVAPIEALLGLVRLKDDGILIVPAAFTGRESEAYVLRAKECRGMEGVIDAKPVLGCVVAVFNSTVKVPEEFPDKLLKQGRAAEFDPSTKTVYIDIANTYHYLRGRFCASWMSSTASHELRHRLTQLVDEKIANDTGEEIDRYDGDKKDDAFLQRAYLDELHSHFFDRLDKKDTAAMNTFDDRFYSTAGKGTHRELAGTTETAREDAGKLFGRLREFISLHDKYSLQSLVVPAALEKVIMRAGAALCISRNVSQALLLVVRECEMLQQLEMPGLE